MDENMPKSEDLAKDKERKEKRKFLIADDETAVARFLKIHLVKKYPDCDVEIVSDGKSLFHSLDQSLASGQKVDITFTDNNMPGMNGIDAVAKVCATHDIKSIPFILLTGRDSEAIRPQAEALGGVCVQKPYSKDDLYEAIDKVQKRHGLVF